MTEQKMPSTPQEVAAAVLDAIEREPESFNMASWFWLGGREALAPRDNVCGTTMCAAGWAAHVTGWALLAECCDESPDCEHEAPMAKRGDEMGSVDLVGAEALGLNPFETFFYEDADTAIQRLREIAGR